MFVHLTTHSAYSLQESLLSPADLVQAAQQHNMPALGLTDHLLLTGSVEFVRACQQAGIQPVLGLEIDLDAGRLTLLAESLEGWSNLCRLSSALALRDDPEAPCQLDLLEAHAQELVALRNPQSDYASARLQDLKEIFPGGFYIALEDSARGIPTARIARQLDLPLVVTQPVRCLRPEQAGLLRTLMAVRQNIPIGQLHAADASQPTHFSSEREMLVRFSSFSPALEKTIEIAERCQFELPIGESNMPAVPLPPGLTPAEFLRQKAEAGAVERYGQITPEIQERLDHELEIISRMGYEPIFLIVEDVLNYARETNVPYSSRGSAASSLVAYCLGITSPDPLQLNLYFERFLNPARLTPPDIDTDLCSRRRDSVIQHVFDTYGADRVAMVATINRYRPRSALADAAKAYGLPPAKVKELSKKLPHSFWARRTNGEEQDSLFSELREEYPGEPFSQIFDDAEAIQDLPRHLSVHPGGLVVSPGPLTDLVPVMVSGSKSIVITQLDLESVEALGLVKIDLLGIRGLTVLGDLAEFIQESEPGRYPTPLSVLDATPADDALTANLVEHGRSIGCFQIESPGMRATLREIKARSEEDIMAALALYRPGPLTGGLKDAFVRRFKGEEAVEHIHPSLAPLLEETFGVILYQEQVLRIANSLAGFTLAEADLLRRAMSHFDPGKRMIELKHKFIQEAEARSSIPAETGERVWEMMAAFAGYGFPKAHAASYAQIAWRSAWCKVHFPAEFMAAVLANWGGYYNQRVYLSEARQLGLEIRPPHVNHAKRNFAVGHVKDERASEHKKALFMGLDQVKHLSRKTIERIIRRRPYTSLEDFLSRVDPRPQEAENLARVGALDGLGLLPAILKRLQRGWQASQMSLFPGEVFEGGDWTLEEKMAAQRELLGISLEAHPLELLADRLAEMGAISTVDAAGMPGERVSVAGIRQTSRRSRTARGEMMMFLTLEDLSGVLEVIIFPEIYRQVKPLLSGNLPMVITGTVEIDRDHEPYLRAEKVTALS